MKEAGGGGKRRGQRARCLCGGPRRRAGTGGRGRGPHAAPERLARCAGGPASGGAAVRGDEPRGAVGQCEGTVQGLDDRRQELPAGLAKEANTHILFILMRFTRLLQFRRVPPRGAATPTSSSTTTDATCSACTSSATSASTRSMSTAGTSDTRAPPASLSSRSALSGTLEHKQLTLNFSSVRIFSPSGDGSAVDGHSPSSKMAFWKKLPSPAEKNKISKNAGAGEIFSRSSLPPPRRTRPARTLERVKYSFSNFSFKNISQLASMNYDLMTKHNLDPLQSSK